MWQIREITYFIWQKGLSWSWTSMYLKLTNSDRKYFLPFFGGGRGTACSCHKTCLVYCKSPTKEGKVGYNSLLPINLGHLHFLQFFSAVNSIRKKKHSVYHRCRKSSPQVWIWKYHHSKWGVRIDLDGIL